jgi:hypothetical protein
MPQVYIRFVDLENLDDNVDISTAWEMLQEV